jgi:hypothetical protein
VTWTFKSYISWRFLCIERIRRPPQLCKVGVFLVWHKPLQIWNGSWPLSSGLRGASLCIAMHRYTSLCIAIHRNASLCIAMHRYTSLCIAINRNASLSIYLHRYTSLCIAMHHWASLCIALHRYQVSSFVYSILEVSFYSELS